MKNLYRILALVTVIVFAFTMVSYASVKDILDAELKEEINYMDDVYKYDLSLRTGAKEEAKEEEVPAEVLKYERAVGIVSALGLITKRFDGTFSEDEILSAADFCSLAEDIVGSGSEYTDLNAITHKTALDMLMKALGYDFIEDTGKYMEMAYRNDILDGIAYNADKHISRGEMAQMLYNALIAEPMELTSIGTSSKYESTEGQSLLYKLFECIEIEGLVTGANGIDIYASRTVEEGTVEIDRASYKVGALVDTAPLLGQRVFGIVDISGKSTVTYLGINPEDKTIRVPLEDIGYSGGKLSWNEDGTEKSISASKITHAAVNGIVVNSDTALSEMLSGEGVVLFAVSQQDGGYDTAIINKYETFVVNRVSSIDERVYLDNGRTFNEQGFVDISGDNYIVNVLKDGVGISPRDIKAGDIISVFSDMKGAIHIEVSSKFVEGEIESIYDDKYMINDKEYILSSAYNSDRTNGAQLPELAVGIEGVFMLNAMGHIANLKDTESVYEYGILKTVGSTSGGLREDIGFRIYTQEAEWFNYYLADKATIDGIKMTKAEAKAYFDGKEDMLSSTIIRFKINRDDEVTALDTVNKLPEEAGDFESLGDEPVEWSGKIEWNKGKTLTGSKYGLSTEAIVFYIPEEKEDEEEYSVTLQKNLTSGTQVKFMLYNPDEYFRSKVVVYNGEAGKGTFPDNSKQFLIVNISKAKDDNERDIFILRGYDAIASGVDLGWKSQKYSTTASIAKNYSDLKPGDLIKRNFDVNGRISELEVIMSVDEVSTRPDECVSFASSNSDDNLWGTVSAVNPTEGLVRISCGAEEYSVTVRIVAIYDSATQRAENVALDDIQPGDKIQVYGGWGIVNAVIYR